MEKFTPYFGRVGYPDGTVWLGNEPSGYLVHPDEISAVKLFGELSRYRGLLSHKFRTKAKIRLSCCLSHAPTG
jgi:hypothetical protein